MRARPRGPGRRTPWAPRAALAAAALLVTGAPAAAQSAGWSIGAGGVFESYSFSDAEATGIETLSLVTVPFAARFELHPAFEVSVAGAWARGSLSLEDGTSSTLSGPTDTSVRGTWTLGNDRVVLAGTAYLPTGSVTHTLEEAAVAGAIASDLLPFRISNWGTGGGADASAAVAVPAGDFALGARVGYRYVAEYEPLDEPLAGQEFLYDPGDELYVRLALDRNLGRASKFSLSGTFQTFGDDATAGTNLFRSGDRFQVTGIYTFPVQRGSGWIYGGVLHRAEGAFLQEFAVEEPPGQNVIFGGGAARLPAGGSVVLPGVDLRVLQTADGLGQGWTLGLGGSAELPLGGGPTLVPTARGRFGSVLVNEDVETGFVGFEVGLTIRGPGR